ncbi:hypothetical protein T12_3867 [Trichinella patagoniensis]|uniref:Uncharacterized protein n=1 Tax=Trichinella patagoniensis TaxID=990121 RepID=A0A0V0YW69_9BILA|nr:hypothetical protein T12_3867 [Trichinella patagoniensis]
MRYREESGGQEHSDFSFCFLMLAISRFQSQLTGFPMYRLAEVEIMPVFRKSGDALRPMFIHCGSHPLENRKLSDSRRLSGRGRGFFIIYCGDGLRFISTSFF